MRPGLNRCCSWAERAGVGRRPSSNCAHAGGKRCQQRQPRPSVFRHYGSVGRGEGACFAATRSWAACSQRITNAELRRLKAASLLGPAPRRSALPETLRRETKVNSRNFFAELKRRNVYKVAVSYAVVGWLLVQAATQVFPFFEIPNWAIRLIVLAVVIGFPIALVIAWAFELTPEGIKRTEDVDALLATNVGVAASERQPRKHIWIFVVLVGA